MEELAKTTAVIPATGDLSQQRKKWQSPFFFLVIASIVMSVTFAGWMAMLNNFVIEQAAFTGAEIGMLQSLREIPGFLAFYCCVCFTWFLLNKFLR